MLNGTNYPTGRKLSLEFKCGKFAKFKSLVILDFCKSVNDSLHDKDLEGKQHHISREKTMQRQ